MRRKTGAYIDSCSRNAVYDFGDVFYKLIKDEMKEENELVILCIGTDRATGDSLGPIIGYKLNETIDGIFDAKVFGTLEYPVHAKNIAETMEIIRRLHDNPFIVAIDACLGRVEHIGYLTLGAGSMKPGAGVNKNLPEVGHIYISGIVNFSNSLDMVTLQNTRLGVVMKMADVVYNGMIEGLKLLYRIRG